MEKVIKKDLMRYISEAFPYIPKHIIHVLMADEDFPKSRVDRMEIKTFVNMFIAMIPFEERDFLLSMDAVDYLKSQGVPNKYRGFLKRKFDWNEEGQRKWTGKDSVDEIVSEFFEKHPTLRQKKEEKPKLEFPPGFRNLPTSERQYFFSDEARTYIDDVLDFVPFDKRNDFYRSLHFRSGKPPVINLDYFAEEISSFMQEYNKQDEDRDLDELIAKAQKRMKQFESVEDWIDSKGTVESDDSIEEDRGIEDIEEDAAPDFLEDETEIPQEDYEIRDIIEKSEPKEEKSYQTASSDPDKKASPYIDMSKLKKKTKNKITPSKDQINQDQWLAENCINTDALCIPGQKFDSLDDFSVYLFGAAPFKITNMCYERAARFYFPDSITNTVAASAAFRHNAAVNFTNLGHKKTKPLFLNELYVALQWSIKKECHEKYNKTFYYRNQPDLFFYWKEGLHPGKKRPVFDLLMDLPKPQTDTLFVISNRMILYCDDKEKSPSSIGMAEFCTIINKKPEYFKNIKKKHVQNGCTTLMV